MILRRPVPVSVRRHFGMVLTVGLAMVAGVVYLQSSRAATPFETVEAEQGTLTAPADKLADTAASGGSAVKFESDVTPTPAPSPTPVPPASWQQAWDTRNQATIDAWYAANTGYAGLGLNPATFWDISSDSIIDEGWLNDNAGNGHVRQENGRWILEKIRSNRIRIAANNVTIRGCSVNANGSDLYGVQHYPTFSNSVSGTVVEYCTFNGQGSTGKTILLYSTVAGIDTVAVRYNEGFGFNTGLDMRGNGTYEYNWIHDLHYSTGSHNAGAVNRNANLRFHRNSIEDGNSSALSIYADSMIYNMVVRENVLNTPRANYCINFPRKTYFEQVTDTHLLDNIFGQKHNPKCGSSGPMAGGKWTTVSGNVYMDGTPVWP